MRLTQTPAPGSSCVQFRGDTFTFSLELSAAVSGDAWLRTTLGNIITTRSEIVKAVSLDESVLERAWYDIPMIRVGPKRFEAAIALTEVGHFEAKCLFLESGNPAPLWPDGDNARINVEPADLCCGNIIYNAFVRQFGPNKSSTVRNTSKRTAGITALDQDGYTVIPPSGTFRDLIGELDFIINVLGCRILHLLPINPTPTTYGRMGRFGSPYAALDFTGIDPALAVFDPRATPLEQFIELVDAVHHRNAKIIIDLAPNHTGWAAELHETHPEWLIRDRDGKIEAPGAWGVVWEDLTRLDFTNRKLWEYMAEVFLTWCHRGVDGFRCDAGYMIPVPAWDFIVASVREQYPDTVFFLEGLGGKISVTRQILNKSNFNWAYSELFQNYDRSQIEAYLPLANRISAEDGLMVHFAETHDNNRLAAISNDYAAMRTALCAFVSHCGGFGFANGVEWFATEKIDVHDACSLNWNAQTNQVKRIRRINRLLTCHPAFFDQARIQMIQQGDGNYLAVLRHHPPSGKRLLVLINIDMSRSVQAAWEIQDAGFSVSPTCTDLLTGQPVSLETKQGRCVCQLQPGAVHCLSPDAEDARIFDDQDGDGSSTVSVHLLPERIIRQRFQSLVLDIRQGFTGGIQVDGLDMEQAITSLVRDPEAFCRSQNPCSEESRVITWNYPCDCRRRVMIPPDHFLLIRSPHPFYARMVHSRRKITTTIAVRFSLQRGENEHFTIIPPIPAPNHPVSRLLKLTVYTDTASAHTEGRVIYLSRAEHATVKTSFTRHELLNRPLRFLGTNGRGGMMRVNAWWGKIETKYDAMLAANLNPDYPDNRWMMLIRCRAWLVFQGYSQEISMDCLKRFWLGKSSRCGWEFAIPCGQGQYAVLIVIAAMIPGINCVRLSFHRKKMNKQPCALQDARPVQIILRPDIDDRSFHHTTKAYTGPEIQWPAAIVPRPQGFLFTPHEDRVLEIRTSSGTFTPEPEWQYMVHLPMDAERGMDPHTDIFSPGYFSAFLKGDETLDLTAALTLPHGIDVKPLAPTAAFFPDVKTLYLHEAMRLAMDHYIVKRNRHKTIIAGYPWFLDWGRDTFIATRGLIIEGFITEATDIIKQFAQFEKNGTLPNVIFGSDIANRDTSDAPLWFVAACKDLAEVTGSHRFLNEPCGGRSLREILLSIAAAYISGTDNGIHADPDTGLIFSPSHFTWMDTNFPAATPREGFPIEIQSLWYNALGFMAQIDTPAHRTRWKDIADQVKVAVKNLFLLKNGSLSDCLHAARGVSAKTATPDDALRPNQLLAVTLGLISDPVIQRAVVLDCASLIIPGGIRSLADRPVQQPLPVYREERLLNDPTRPYFGVYSGDEDTRRKPAYHNGTAWTWLFPSFCEAWAIAFGDTAKGTARAFLGSSAILANAGSAGQLPEIMDGDFPHRQKGCDAQAWAVSEWLRVWRRLSS